MSEKIHYSAAVDPIVYGPTTSAYTCAEWLALASAALDQASAAAESADRAPILKAMSAVDELRLCDGDPGNVASPADFSDSLLR